MGLIDFVRDAGENILDGSILDDLLGLAKKFF
jgi:hypothetical protein